MGDLYASVTVFLVGMIGASIASFLNVAVFGGDNSMFKNITRKRSHCDNCERKLNFVELIPVFGWVLSGGRCWKCKRRITVLHFVSEALMFIFFSLIWLKFMGNFGMTFFGWFVVTYCYFFSIYDIKYGIVPNKYLLVAAMLIFLSSIIYVIYNGFDIHLVKNYLFAALGYSLVFAIVNIFSMLGIFPLINRKVQAFGWGDAKLALIIGLSLGVNKTFISWWIAVFSGALYGVILMLIKNKKIKGKTIPFVPFMALGSVISLLWGDLIYYTVILYLGLGIY
ncbi:prepilin peptidase [Candidatus Dojkabacteria bacterium]|nr:prepilin peptidase [Candidatus Dojkabacteria bacterium]